MTNNCYTPPFPPCETDVYSYPDFASFPTSGTEDKLYIDLDTGTAYFWDGIAYSPVQSEQEIYEQGGNIFSTTTPVVFDALGDEWLTWNTATRQIKRMPNIASHKVITCNNVFNIPAPTTFGFYDITSCFNESYTNTTARPQYVTCNFGSDFRYTLVSGGAATVDIAVKSSINSINGGVYGGFSGGRRRNDSASNSQQFEAYQVQNTVLLAPGATVTFNPTLLIDNGGSGILSATIDYLSYVGASLLINQA